MTNLPDLITFAFGGSAFFGASLGALEDSFLLAKCRRNIYAGNSLS